MAAILLLLALQTQATGSLVVALRDSAGHPVTLQATVYLTESRRKLAGNPNGQYRIDSVPVGRLSVATLLVGYEERVDTVVIQPRIWTRVTFMLRPMPPLAPVVEEMNAMPATSPPSYEGFGVGLFREATRFARDSNVFLSPASAAFSLAMAYGGSGGSTQSTMAHALGVDGTPPEQLGPENATLLKSLGHQSGVQLSIASSLWVSEGRPFLELFLRQTEEWYHAPVRSLVLHSAAAKQQINAWVAEATNGKIKTILSDTLDESDAMVLLNAVYFKGRWRDTFDTSATKPHAFTLASGRVVRRPLMSRSGMIAYERGPGFQAVRLPYEGGRLAMYVFLPDSGVTLSRFAATMDTARWNAWMNGFSETRLHIGLPKFHIEYQATLNHELGRLGMGIAFNDQEADFSGMLPRAYLADTNAYIAKVFQKTYVDVTEQGTEAAATTGVVVGVTPTAVMRSVEMIVDHPFVVAIRDDRTGLLLFLGQITDP